MAAQENIKIIKVLDSAIILFAHGARDAQWAEPFVRIRDQLERALSTTPVVVAFLECMSPTLEQAVRELARQGIRKITLIPMFLARGGHLKQDLPLLIAAVQKNHPELTLHISPAIGESEAILHALSDWILREHRHAGQ